jgi:hypothetical protein
MSLFTADQIKAKMQTSDQWLMVGMLTIFNLQTDDEKNTEHTQESNGVGFNGPDSRTLTKCSTWLLQKASIQELRRLPNTRLESFFTADWARDAIRNKMPKYSGQLAMIANRK